MRASESSIRQDRGANVAWDGMKASLILSNPSMGLAAPATKEGSQSGVVEGRVGVDIGPTLLTSAWIWDQRWSDLFSILLVSTSLQNLLR